MELKITISTPRYLIDSSDARFNSLFISSFDERNFRGSNQCRGDCDEIFLEKYNLRNSKIHGKYSGKLHACEPIFTAIKVRCQLCACLCERTFDPNLEVYQGDLLDSFCLDSVSVDPGYVATGVRFRRYENRIHIELQQGKLKNWKLIEETISWKSTDSCKKSQKIIDNVKNWYYEGFKVALGNFILPTNAIITGITLNKFVRGKYLDFNGNIDEQSTDVYELVQYGNSTRAMEHYYANQLINDNAWNSSVPCNGYVAFKGTSFMEDYMQHIIPFVDLHEIVTNPPRPIRGIGWYLQKGSDFPQLSLQIF
ncbi:hypothetical protein KQX54_010897 [Cotesia glomerata]|uniref:Uncharacterized protein n=1 Tax=Cotesia glomerata TaxID=32391 RepID=A0AAV7J0K2_COTGL|nr:hypothetical protein KQX54_010897 [Cotesia glomerata]